MGSEYFTGEVSLAGQGIPWQSVFPKGTTFGCERCGICCTRLELTEKDIDILKSNNLSSALVCPDPNLTPIKPFIKLYPSGFCSLLDERHLCSIYNLRPLVCRAYPIIPTPGFDGELLVDIALKCPFVGVAGEPEITETQINESLTGYIDHLSDNMLKALQYRNSLAAHLRSSYPASMPPRQERLGMMDAAIDKFATGGTILDLSATLKGWSDNLSLASHKVIADEYRGATGGPEQQKKILSQLSSSAPLPSFSKEWFSSLISDVNNMLFIPHKKGVMPAIVKPGFFGVKIGKSKHSWGSLWNLAYSEGAIDEVAKYLRIFIRRAGFQLSVAFIAEYLLDFKKVAAIDYSLESILIANSISPYLDSFARVVAVSRGHDSIDASDVRFAISNMDNHLLAALTNGVIVSEVVTELNKIFGNRQTR